ncbi:hypothetical protein F4781DRAFT_209756 [Annulohypoxylon bovei var. microspora]|nr:hypothetical protein F4781DRAFT_209756 [Annulohypoxylon bovei var. microspora]
MGGPQLTERRPLFLLCLCTELAFCHTFYTTLNAGGEKKFSFFLVLRIPWPVRGCAFTQGEHWTDCIYMPTIPAKDISKIFNILAWFFFPYGFTYPSCMYY